MPDVNGYLREIVQAIEPTANQVQAASASHNHLRALLSSGQIGQRIVDSYLGGSYSRDTALRPIDDVDIVFVVNASGWSTSWTGLPSPSAVLSTFANAIRYRYPVSSVFGQRRSVRLQLNHLDIDVVPAVPASTDATVVRIPDADTDDWILSAPKLHAKKAAEVNTARAGLFKPLVKLLKFWNANLPEPARFKSFAIETMATRIFSDVPFSDLNDGLLKFLDFCSSAGGRAQLYQWSNTFGMTFGVFGVSVPDAAGTASNTAADVDGAKMDTFVTRAAVSLDRVLAANRSNFTATARAYVDGALRK